MKSLSNCLIRSTLIIAATVGVSATLHAQDANAVGVVRISSPKSASVDRGQLLPVSATQVDVGCINSAGTPMASPNGGPAFAGMGGPAYAGMNGESGPICNGDCNGNCKRGCRSLFGRNGQFSDQLDDCWGSEFDGQGMGHRHGRGHCRSGYHGRYSDQAICDYLRCKFGYFIPTGGDGHGLPLAGHYSRVYPVNPYSNDSRDGQAWAAQGYGIPISVPLAPVVGHTYEYGWGIPSSRLVPVSRPAY